MNYTLLQSISTPNPPRLSSPPPSSHSSKNRSFQEPEHLPGIIKQSGGDCLPELFEAKSGLVSLNPVILYNNESIRQDSFQESFHRYGMSSPRNNSTVIINGSWNSAVKRFRVIHHIREMEIPGFRFQLTVMLAYDDDDDDVDDDVDDDDDVEDDDDDIVAMYESSNSRELGSKT